MICDLYELHPGFSEWGRRVAEERGFTDDDADDVLRVSYINLEELGLEHHIQLDDADFIVKRITHVKRGVEGEWRTYPTQVHMTYNGKVSP
jgi:hypothetical protein